MTIAWARFEIPARVKTDPILNNYLTQTMENNARSVVRCVQAEMSFIFIFPTVVQEPHFPFGNALEEEFLWENLWLPRSNHWECGMSTKKGERMPLQATLLTKVL